VVYVGSYDGNIYALNATTGANVWNYTTGASVYSSPSVANGVVYVGSENNNVHAVGYAAVATSQGTMSGFGVVLILVVLLFVGLVIAAYVVRRGR
jgi:outer membrane protein assembly factor BamB